jgi:mono/diheme cytochrome c family protein
VAPVLLGLTLVPGCESDTFSEAIQFRVRTDPIVKEVFPGERVEPDRPGQLPLLTMSQLGSLSSLFEGTSQSIESKVIDPTKISDADRQKLQDTLDDIFGTPAHPRLMLKGTEALAKLLRTKKENLEDTLAHGSRKYRLQCLQCHGVTGDGRGPTAPWVNPHPRDYRPGLFKFQSVSQTDGSKRKPMRADLLRTLRHGVEGTAMPAFNLLPDDDLESLVSYVTLLSLRGEAELYAFTEAMDVNGKTGELTVKKGKRLAKEVQEAVVGFAETWADAANHPIEAAAYPKYDDEEMKASVRRGQALFVADVDKLKTLYPRASDEQLNKLKGVSCVSCHKDYGRLAVFKFDVWGTMVRPANLTMGVYRGGRRPIDLYWRIHSGINGSGMNFFGPPPSGEPGLLTGEQIWDLVNFVRAVAYPAMMKGCDIDIY